MLCEPQRVPAGFVHQRGNRLGLVEDAGEMLVGETPLIGGCRILAAIGNVDMAGIDRCKLRDHDSAPWLLPCSASISSASDCHSSSSPPPAGSRPARRAQPPAARMPA